MAGAIVRGRPNLHEVVSWGGGLADVLLPSLILCLFATGATRTLVANKAEVADTLTTAQITAQLFYSVMKPGLEPVE